MGSRWKVDWRWLTFFSALAATVYKANDVYVTHRFFSDPSNELMVALTYLIIGGWIGLISNIVFSKFFGKKLDTRFNWFTPASGRVQIYAFGAGTLSAVSTFFMLWGSSLYDPSLVIPLGSLSIVFLVFYDLYRREVSVSEILWPMTLIILGSVAISVYKVSASLPQITFKAIVLLLIFRGLFDAISSIFSRNGVGIQGSSESTDAINFAFWRFLWLVVAGTILAVIFLIGIGKFATFIEILETQFFAALPFVLLTMFFVFFGNALSTYAYSLKEGAVSRVSMLLNIQLVLGVPATLLITRLDPSVLGNLSTDFFFWLLKVTGSILIFGGVYLLIGKRQG